MYMYIIYNSYVSQIEKKITKSKHWVICAVTFPLTKRRSLQYESGKEEFINYIITVKKPQITDKAIRQIYADIHK